MTNASDGYFPGGSSILNHVHAQRAVGLLYGQRALMIGGLNPIAFIGTTQRSKAHDHPWKRLTTRRSCSRRCSSGHARRPTGRWPSPSACTTASVEKSRAGSDRTPQATPYSAFDPELMLWVVARCTTPP